MILKIVNYKPSYSRYIGQYKPKYIFIIGWCMPYILSVINQYMPCVAKTLSLLKSFNNAEYPCYFLITLPVLYPRLDSKSSKFEKYIY